MTAPTRPRHSRGTVEPAQSAPSTQVVPSAQSVPLTELAPSAQSTPPTPVALPIQSDASWQDGDEMRWAARHWAARIGVRIGQLHLRQMKTKWASISPTGRLTLNTELLDLPKPLGEYVIVHELVHLLVPNHARVFKLFMHAYLPDWEVREGRLRRARPRSADPKR
jgi:Protein of unknown function DUF45